VVFIGGTTGTIYAYSTETGKAIWQYNTAKSFTTVNGVEAKGGNFASSGPVIANGMMVVTSGYSDLFGGSIPRGNVLLTFRPE
jgi:polyvinyl alcohol dehydrogenase (cytochrome)